jgi:hypothetical protein
MATATFIRQMNWESDARLYRVVPPVSQTRWNPDSDQDETNTFDYVVVSASGFMGRPETFIFPADKNGEVDNYYELDGSFRGALDHERALRNAGYDVA